MGGEEPEDENKEGNDTYSILLLEKDFDISDQLGRILNNSQRFSCNITVSRKGKNALDYIEDNRYDVIMADYQMPDMNGIDFLKRAKEEDDSDALRILIMEEGDTYIAERAVREGDIHQYLENPWNSEEVRSVVCEELQDIKGKEKKRRVDVDDVSEALNTVKKFQDKITEDSHSSTKKETLIFEFDSSSEFNKFSFELKRMKNIQILDVNVFENKYVINVGLYPESYEKIS